MRSSNRYTKFARAHHDQLEELNTGAKYETGIAIKVAKKSIKKVPKRNPEGMLLSEQKCPYSSDKYCVTKENKDCRSSTYFMYGKLKELRDGISKEIEQEVIALEIASKANNSKSI